MSIGWRSGDPRHDDHLGPCLLCVAIQSRRECFARKDGKGGREGDGLQSSKLADNGDGEVALQQRFCVGGFQDVRRAIGEFDEAECVKMDCRTLCFWKPRAPFANGESLSLLSSPSIMCNGAPPTFWTAWKMINHAIWCA